MLTSKVLVAAIVLVHCFGTVYGRIGKGWQDLTKHTFHEFVHDNERVLVDFYDSKDADWPHQQSELDAALVLVRDSGLRVPVAKVDAAAEGKLARKYVKNGVYPQLMWFMHGKPTQYHHAFRNAEMIAAFVMALDRPALTKIDKIENATAYSRTVLAITKEKSQFYQVLEVVALRHMETIAFTFMEGPNDKMLYMGDKKAPVPYNGIHTVEGVDKWIKSMLPFKSEAVPLGEAAMDGYSHTIVGNNFEEMVLQKDKDVMLLVHAPWCGHCRQMHPAWNALGRAVANEPRLLIGKMDGSRNNSPLPFEFTWQSYPTIFYVRAGETWPIVFHGNRTSESLLAFAKEHATKPLNLDETVDLDL